MSDVERERLVTLGADAIGYSPNGSPYVLVTPKDAAARVVHALMADGALLGRGDGGTDDAKVEVDRDAEVLAGFIARRFGACWVVGTTFFMADDRLGTMRTELSDDEARVLAPLFGAALGAAPVPQEADE